MWFFTSMCIDMILQIVIGNKSFPSMFALKFLFYHKLSMAFMFFQSSSPFKFATTFVTAKFLFWLFPPWTVKLCSFRWNSLEKHWVHWSHLSGMDFHELCECVALAQKVYSKNHTGMAYFFHMHLCMYNVFIMIGRATLNSNLKRTLMYTDFDILVKISPNTKPFFRPSTIYQHCFTNFKLVLLSMHIFRSWNLAKLLDSSNFKVLLAFMNQISGWILGVPGLEFICCHFL